MDAEVSLHGWVNGDLKKVRLISKFADYISIGDSLNWL